jgi:Spy/CpxP family protein refolding chaperone
MKTDKQMSENSKNRVFISIITVLLVTNIALLVFFLWVKPHRNLHPDMRHDMIAQSLENKIGFDQQQMTQYQRLKEDHKVKMKPLFEDMRNTKDQFYRLLQQPSSDSGLNKAADLIGEKQKAIDLQIFHHFKDLRDLCTAQQQPKFDSLIQEVIHRMSVPYHKRNMDKKDSIKSD